MPKQSKKPKKASSDLQHQHKPPLSVDKHDTESSVKSSLSETWWVSLCILVHFGCLLLAFSGNFGQSSLVREWSKWTSNYTVTTGQYYGWLPVEWTHADDFETPILVEVLTKADDGSNQWQSLDVTRLGKRWKNFTRYLGLVYQDNPESEFIAETAFRLLQGSGELRNQALQIRFIYPHIPTYDEQLAITSGAEQFLGESVEPTTIFQAIVTREEGQFVGLVPILEPYRMSPPLRPQS